MTTGAELALSSQAERSFLRPSLVPILDPTWETVTQLFPGQTGMKILLAILASAVIVQRSLPEWGLVDVAVLHCQSLTTFAHQLGCGKDTVLRYVTLYQALGFLTYTPARRGAGADTQLHLPLRSYQPSVAALERVKALTLGGRKKQQDLARSVSEQYVLLYGLPVHLLQETGTGEDPVLCLLTRTSHLLQKQRIRRVERQLLHREITDVLGDLQSYHQGDLFLQWRDQKAEQGDLATHVPSAEEDLSSKQGDLSHNMGDRPERAILQPGDLPPYQGDVSPQTRDEMPEVGDLQAGAMLQPGDLTPYQGDVSSQNDKNRLDVGDLPRNVGDLNVEAMQQSGNPVPDTGDLFPQNRNEAPEAGDLKDVGSAPSSIDLFPIKDSSKKEVELELQISEQWAGSEQDLTQEAIRYLKLLDGPEYATADYLNTHAGKKALGGYRNKIRRSPWFARVAAINALLHRTFYDLTRQKKPLENAGKWFHSSFDRYRDPHRPMEIIGEILDWAKSPYTLEEIAVALSQERHRQETQWWPPEVAHLPFSSCVVTYHSLHDTASTKQATISERQHDAGVPSETAWQETEQSMEGSLSPWMSATEAEYVAEEMRQEASWYLERISARPDPLRGDQAYIVEASILDSAFVVAYATRQDWWHDHQEQLRHRRWKEQQKGKKRRTQRTAEGASSGVAP